MRGKKKINRSKERERTGNRNPIERTENKDFVVARRLDQEALEVG